MHGELLTLGVKVAASTVWEILREAGTEPAPDRAATTWAQVLRSQAEALLAADFLETVTLTGTRVYVLAVIEHASRRIRVLGATVHPSAAWVTQTARNLVMDLQDAGCPVKYLIRDRNGKYPALFDTILADAGITVVLSGVRIPRMNAVMERWVQTCRRELLDRTLIFNQQHLLHALREYEVFYSTHRPYQGITNARPLVPLPEPITDPDRLAHLNIHLRDRLGGILHEYEHAAYPDGIFGRYYGGMSKGERNRIKIRVRSAMAAQAAMEGRFLGGRPPYGYRLADAGPHPNPGKAADGKRLHRLEVDPITAPVVQRIYRDYLAGAGIYAIAERLARDGILSPSAADPARNSHRHVQAWGKSAIRVILTNPRYTGRQVWNKQRKAEILIDVDDVALGHETKMRWNPTQEWIYSTTQAHEALIDDETFEQVQTTIAAGTRPPAVDRKPRRSKRTYAFSGLLFCGLCDRRMIGCFNNNRNHYRCTYAAEYADANRLAHPRSLYLREDKIVELVDPWIRRAFSPTNLRTTLQAMADAQHNDTDQHRVIAAREKINLCRTKLDRYRAALDAGTDPVLVQQWITQVQAEKATAEADLRRITGRRTMTADEINTLIEAQAGIATILRQADPTDKAEVYRQLGIKLTYKPAPRLIQAEASPNESCTKVCPRPELLPYYMIVARDELRLTQ